MSDGYELPGAPPPETPLEISIEKTFAARGEARGCLVLKLVPLGRAGFMDRTVIAPGARIAFAELKRKGKKPRRLQQWWINTFRRYGFLVQVVDSVEAVDAFYDEFLGPA